MAVQLNFSASASASCSVIPCRVMGMNYGFDEVRFILPVACGSKIRGRFKLSEVTRRSDRELILRYAVSIEIEEKEKPALAAEWLTIAFLG